MNKNMNKVLKFVIGFIYSLLIILIIWSMIVKKDVFGNIYSYYLSIGDNRSAHFSQLYHLYLNVSFFMGIALLLTGIMLVGRGVSYFNKNKLPKDYTRKIYITANNFHLFIWMLLYVLTVWLRIFEKIEDDSLFVLLNFLLMYLLMILEKAIFKIIKISLRKKEKKPDEKKVSMIHSISLIINSVTSVLILIVFIFLAFINPVNYPKQLTLEEDTIFNPTSKFPTCMDNRVQCYDPNTRDFFNHYEFDDVKINIKDQEIIDLIDEDKYEITLIYDYYEDSNKDIIHEVRNDETIKTFTITDYVIHESDEQYEFVINLHPYLDDLSLKAEDFISVEVVFEFEDTTIRDFFDSYTFHMRKK